MTEQATTDALPVTIRPVSRDPAARELDFVVETSVKVRWPRRAGIPWYEWRELHQPQAKTWARDGLTMVADAGDSTLLGFIVIEGGSVRMLYVKREFRGDGIGLRLLSTALGRDIPSPLPATLPTPSWRRWCERHAITWEKAR